MRLLVALETRLARDPATGRVHSRLGFDAAPFWRRYLEVFDEVVVAARTADAPGGDLPLVDGPGVRVAPLPDYQGPWGHLRARRALARALRSAVAGADALCLRAPGPIASLAWAVRGDRPVGVEVVGDPYDALAPGAVRSLARPLARRLLARDLRRLCRAADAVAYVTAHALQRRYPARGWSTSFSSIELEDDAFRTVQVVDVHAAGLARRALTGDAAPWRLVTAGSLAQEYKGHDVLLAALARLCGGGRAFELTIVGDGRVRPALERRVRTLGLTGRVRFAGRVPAGAAVRALLDAGDVFVLPSRTEGLPRALIEAMARGLPAVATAVGGVPELLPPERLAAPGDTCALADRLAALCTATTDFQALGRHNRAVAEGYRSAVLRPRRRAFYGAIRAAAEARLRGDPERRPAPGYARRALMLGSAAPLPLPGGAVAASAEEA